MGKTNHKKWSYKDNPYFALIYIKSALYWLPARLEKWNLYVSGLFSIIRAIQTIIMHKLPWYDLDIEMFSGLLTRHTVHKFYHIWPEWKKVLEKVDNQSRSDDPYKETFEKSVAILFESLRVSYMETTNKKNREFSSSLSEMFKKLENSKGDAFNKIFKKVVGMAGHLLQSKVKEGKDRDILRFSRDGIKKQKQCFRTIQK